PAEMLPTRPPPPPSGDWFKQLSDFAAGAGDAVSFGLTKLYRQAAGYDDVVDYSSAAYGAGAATGQLINAGLMVFGTPWRLGALVENGAVTGWAATGLAVLNGVGTAGQVVAFVEAARAGDWETALLSLVGAGLTLTRGIAPCQLGGALGWVQRGLHAWQGANGLAQAADRWEAGDFFGAFAAAADAGANLFLMAQACFPEGTPLRTLYGSRSEERRVGRDG